MRSNGIGLNVDNLATISKWLQNSNLEDDIFLASSESISGSKPTELSQDKILEMLTEYHKIASTMSFASAKGAWAFMNELSYPSFYAKWSATLTVIQTSELFMTQPSYDPKDRLYTIRGRTAGMQYI
jgi:hypothetical protein